ncbi:hypothetical protein GA0116948_104262 [Chitinophaga costaii]|uniref:Uncharacterized protein n=1 Tax=Chitinophaga costaii TaxID=1335309 RepID=A0A1C4CRX3_9BACT|nr:hypothetical protein [Chitinophaga costaii]PUZ26979.1 hypothetical protein DCM91_07000 [Chitinophaga costaii]SCC21772.1 hypothetical protein GA0116948_104262 [Chitinophaga costaii]
MKIVCIFVEGNNGLWSIQLPGEPQHEFDKFFNAINDVEWLKNFFTRNEDDLCSGYFRQVNVNNAVLKTFEEAAGMEDALYTYWEQGCLHRGGSLEHLFKPLHNFEYAVGFHQKSKARLRNGWLRLYAIRLDRNCFLVTGGAIKLTQDMHRPHLQQELRKLAITKGWLQEQGIHFPEDLNTYQED